MKDFCSHIYPQIKDIDTNMIVNVSGHSPESYAKRLEPKIGIPYTVITPLIFIFVRACVHYAMFEDEYYLKSQMEVLKQGVALFVDKYKANQA